MKKALKYRVYEALVNKEAFVAFESWLYDQKEFADQMEDELIYDLLTFNYKSADSFYDFKKLIEKHFSVDECDFCFVKRSFCDFIEVKKVDYYALDKFNEIGIRYNYNNAVYEFSLYEEYLQYTVHGSAARNELVLKMLIKAQEIFDRMELFESKGGVLLTEFIEQDQTYLELKEEEDLLRKISPSKKDKIILILLVVYAVMYFAHLIFTVSR